MAIFRLGDKTPTIDPSVYIAETASVIGDVTIGAGSSVWSSAVIRADNDSITIGAGTNIQDGAVLHADPGEPLVIGSNVTVGHQAMLHGCTVEDGALIGIQAVVLNQALIRKNSLVGACALVTEGKEYAAGTLIIGTPAKAVREITLEMLKVMHADTADYVRRAKQFCEQLKRIG
ncbi:MAG: gamma carbonic anhydrase family protein [Alphaproteobacteria bacterium]|jgi:carbonic anhydrase/acetyltransferase-like protein (isoleucine patch superfamily)|nr:gamma carbonic anhydrase family protein [Alphaproteobacteria bacterium]